MASEIANMTGEVCYEDDTRETVMVLIEHMPSLRFQEVMEAINKVFNPPYEPLNG